MMRKIIVKIDDDDDDDGDMIKYKYRVIEHKHVKSLKKKLQ